MLFPSLFLWLCQFVRLQTSTIVYKAQKKDGKMYSKPFKWEGIAGPSLKQLSIFSFMHQLISFYMQWVFFISQKVHLLKADLMTFVVGKCLTTTKSSEKKCFQFSSFLPEFSANSVFVCLVFRHHLKHFHNFTNLKQEHEPSHFILSYLLQEWGFIHKAFWNGLFKCTIYNRDFYKAGKCVGDSFWKEDRQEGSWDCLAGILLSLNEPKEGVVWSVGEKEANC